MGGVDWSPEPEQLAEEERRRKEGEHRLQCELDRLAEVKAKYDAERRAGERAIRDLGNLQKLTPIEFEDVVGSLFMAMEWHVFWTRASGDHGIDHVALKDRTRAAIQCKRYEQDVGEPAVRAFYGSFTGKFKLGYFVTTSSFTVGARKWAKKRNGLTLISGMELVEMIKTYEPTMPESRPIWGGDI